MLNALKKATNYTYTENGAITHKSTLNKVLDMFAMGGACRSRHEEEIRQMFYSAFEEDEILALKCLFYLRDVRGGQGERRFFRVILKHLANTNPEAVRRNLEHIAEFGRWDDYYTLVDTPVEEEVWELLKVQLALDVQSKTPSLLAKWLKSENASSAETRYLGHKTREAFGMTARQYRKTLSVLRERINVLERLMSANRWDEIEFDAIPSKAGLIYRNAFARRDIIKAKYEAFAKNKDTKVNADVLNPVDIAIKCFGYGYWNKPSDVDRAMLDKYWANLKDYYAGREEKGVCVVDVSGSMSGIPMAAAVSLGAYIAERGAGPFKNHFITFSSQPSLVEFTGVDIYDKFMRAKSTEWGTNTDLKAVFNLLLRTAINERVIPENMPERIYIFSDMEFDRAFSKNFYRPDFDNNKLQTLMEDVKDEWKAHGYKLPSVVFWNLRSAHDNIPAIGEGFSYVSGYNPVMIDTILSGKDGWDLCLEKLNSDRYSVIH